MPQPPSPFLLYELAVQSPNWQVDYLPQFHQWLTGKNPVSFREDFCGSGRIACEWAKRSPKNHALGLDIDPTALAYANKINRAALTSKEQSRVTFLKQNVLKPTKEKFDMIGAYNFSFFIFHERKEMLQYAKAALKSLNKKGTLFLEVGGGPGFVGSHHETKKIKVPGFKKPVEQIWEQHPFDPITAVNDYSMHFKLPSDEILNDAFTYHWRIWSIRELREILADAGFKKSVVLWEENEQFYPVEDAPQADSWVAYVIGVK